jgi:hydrogenase expression/formation protein HypC
MCLTAPVHVISVDGATAVVDAGGLRRTASTLVVPEIQPGDWALMNSGALVRIVEPSLAIELAAALRTATGDQP